MSRFIRMVTVFVAVLFLVCARASGREQITLYTSVPTRIMADIEKAFEKRNRGIDLSVFRSGTGRITAKIAAERQAGKIQADVVWVADFAYYEVLKEENLLLTYRTDAAADIPDELKDEDGRYYAARMISSVIAYNTRFVKKPPQSWGDLLKRKWNRQVVMANPLYSGAALDTTGALIKNYGLDFYRGLRANRAVVVRGNTGAAGKIASGEFPVGITLDYIVRNMKEKGSPIEVVYPTDGAIVIPSPIGIIHTTDQPEASKAFLDFALSEEGQKILREVGKFVPVRPDLDSPKGVPSLKKLMSDALPTDWDYIRRKTKWLREQFAAIMLD